MRLLAMPASCVATSGRRGVRMPRTVAHPVVCACAGADAAEDAAPLKLYVVQSAFALDAPAEANGNSSSSSHYDHPHIVPVGHMPLAERMARAFVRLTTVKGSENAFIAFVISSSLCGAGVAALALLGRDVETF